MKHFLAWNPDDTIAYRASSEAEARAIVCGLPALGGRAEWRQATASGWRIAMVEELGGSASSPKRRGHSGSDGRDGSIATLK
jgi:hypothetical protein